LAWYTGRHACYLVFSLTPNQKAEDPKTLLAAAAEDAKQLMQLRIDPAMAKQATDEFKALAARVEVDIAQIGADHVGERAARNVADAKENDGKVTLDKWKPEFEKLWKDYEPQLTKSLHLQDDSKKTDIVAAIKDNTISKWTRRIEALHDH